MSFLSLLIAAVGIITLITGGVVKVEFGLAGIIQGRKERQDCLHNHQVLATWRIFRVAIRHFQFSRAARTVWMDE